MLEPLDPCNKSVCCVLVDEAEEIVFMTTVEPICVEAVAAPAIELAAKVDEEAVEETRAVVAGLLGVTGVPLTAGDAEDAKLANLCCCCCTCTCSAIATAAFCF